MAFKTKCTHRKKNDGTHYVKTCSCNHPNLRKISFGEQYPALVKLYDEVNNSKSIFDIYTTKEASEEYIWNCDKCHMQFPSTIHSMIMSINKDNNGYPFCAHVKVRPGESFADLHPELMEEYDESNTIDPYNTFPNCKDTAIWNCSKCGHKWPATFHLRHIGNGKCPICYPLTPIPDVNTVKAMLPDIAKMWSPSNSKTANEMIYTATHWVNLVCPECKQEFGTFLNEFVNGDYDCPFCNNRKPIPNKNSLKALYPEIAEIWSPNNTRKPENVFPHSTDQAKFVCNICNGEYTCRVYEIVSGDKDCPYCNNRKVLRGFNSVEDKYPKIAEQWSSNNGIKPYEVIYNSRTYIKFDCPDCGGEFGSYLDEYISGEADCPYCNDRKPLPGYNSLQDRYPEIAKLWSDSNVLTAAEVLSKYTYPAKWDCPVCGGEFSAPINEMVDGTADWGAYYQL